MAVRPIDSLTTLPRLNEAARTVQQQEQAPFAFQQVLGAQVQQQKERGRTQVRRREAAEQPVIREEGQNKGRQARPKSGGGGRRQPTAEPPAQRESGSGRLDVKV